MNKTTIQITEGTLLRLKSFKQYERESYDEIVNNVLNQVQEESLSTEELSELQEALEDVKRGRVTSIENIAKDLGITLKHVHY